MKAGYVLLISAAITALAQEPAAVPVDQEPHHKVVFKNDFVRVIDATFPAGYVTLNHTHDVDNVAVTISTGRENAGSAGRAGFSKGGYAHRVTNPGPGIMRFIAVEIFKTDHPGSSAAQLQHHILETENDRVRVYRVKLNADESMPVHSHPAGWLEVTVNGGNGPGTTQWHRANESSVLKGSGAPLEIVEIEPK